MSSPRLIRSGRPPRDMNVDGFDLVHHEGRQLLVGSHYPRQACTWDLATGEWTEYDLASPWLGEGYDYTELAAVGAVVVDGRIVIGGGGDHQGFASWDLASGAVRVFVQGGGVASVTKVDLAGRTMFVAAGTSGTGLELWDAASTEEESEGPSPYDANVSVEELCATSGAVNAVAVGRLDGLAVLVANDQDDEVTVWDLEGECPMRTMAGGEIEEPQLFTIAPVDGRARLVVAGDRFLAVGDPGSGEWERVVEVPGEDITCMDAKTVAGRSVAATGHHDGSFRLWDLDKFEPLGEPCREDGYWVHDVRVTEVEGRAVVVSAASRVQLWEVPG